MVRVASLCLACLVTSGCAQVFGLDPTEQADARPVDPLRATFTAEAIYFGAAYLSEPFEFSDATLKAWAYDPSAPGGLRSLPINFTGPNASCDLPLGNEGLWQVDLPPPFEAIPRFFPITDQTRAYRTAIGFAGGKSLPVPPPANAQLDVGVTLSEPYVAGDGLSLFVAGRWLGHHYQAPPAVGAGSFDPPPIAYSQLFNYVRPGVSSVATEDRAYLTRSRGAQLVGAVRFEPFTQTDGVVALTGTQVAVQANQTLNVSADFAGAVSRVMPLSPNGLVQDYWAINAVRESRYNFSLGIQLTAGPTNPVLGSITGQFGNPFEPDYRPMLLWVLTGIRHETDPDGQVWGHYRGLHMFDREPTSGKRYLADPGLPNGVSLNGVLLVNDKQVLAVPQTQTLEFSFTADRMEGEFRHIDCYRYDLNPQRHTIVLTTRVAGNRDRVRIPATALPRGARYMCRAHLYKGIPKASEGDDTVRDPELRYAFYDSASFIVQ